MAIRSVCGQHPSDQPICASPPLVSRSHPAHSRRREWCSGGQTYLQHVQQRRLARVVQTEEKELGVFVQQTERRKHVPDCAASAHIVSCCLLASAREVDGAGRGEGRTGGLTPVDDPHGCRYLGELGRWMEQGGKGSVEAMKLLARDRRRVRCCCAGGRIVAAILASWPLFFACLTRLGDDDQKDWR